VCGSGAGSERTAIAEIPGIAERLARRICGCGAIKGYGDADFSGVGSAGLGDRSGNNLDGDRTGIGGAGIICDS
jgi:hypothetical protein